MVVDIKSVHVHGMQKPHIAQAVRSEQLRFVSQLVILDGNKGPSLISLIEMDREVADELDCNVLLG